MEVIRKTAGKSLPRWFDACTGFLTHEEVFLVERSAQEQEDKSHRDTDGARVDVCFHLSETTTNEKNQRRPE